MSSTNGPAAPLLSCRGIDVSYGSVQVLFDVDLDVAEGEILALLGTNGAGKSTILKAMSGLVKPTAGTVTFDGTNVVGWTADATTRAGMSQMPGGRGVFPTLSVQENLRMASWMFRKDRDRITRSIDEVLELFPRLSERSTQLAGDLSGGEQQMLTLAQAFMGRPKLLMIDELSLGLAPTVVSQLLEVVRGIHEAGTTIVVVEQSINVALNLAQRAVFMEKGEVRFEGPTADLLDRPDILRSVFIVGAGSAGEGPTSSGGNGKGRGKGRRATSSTKSPDEGAALAAMPARVPPSNEAPVVLECREVTKRFGGVRAVDGVSLELRDGEILGLIGQNGAGKTTLFDCISGFHRIDSGHVLLRDTDISDWAPHWRARNRLGRSFQEARLFPSLSTAEVIAVAFERHIDATDMSGAALRLPANRRSERSIARKVDDLIDLMGLGAFTEKLVGELSTGSRRIVELACILAQDPSVLLLDEPSGGVAQKETEALGPLLVRVQQHTGCSIMVIEHDMPLLSSICDRMVCLELGQPIAEGRPAEVLAHPRVVESYLGTDDAAINRSGAR